MTASKQTEKAEGEVIEGEIVDKSDATPEDKQLYELKLISPTEDGFLKQILWNKEELKAAIAELMKRYKDAPYDNPIVAKTDRANLNKLIKAIDDKRKEVKKKFLEPYNAFEADVKEILELIEQPRDQIDIIIKKAEQQQKEQKRRELKAQFEQVMRRPENSEIWDYVTFDRVFEDRYLNVSVTLAQAWIEMRDKIDSVRNGVAAIENGDSPHKDAMKSVFLRTWDMTSALEEEARLTKLAAQRIEAEKRKAEQEEAKRKAAEQEAEKHTENETQEASGHDERGDNTAENKQPEEGAGNNGASEKPAGQKDNRSEGTDSPAAASTGTVACATFRVFGTVEQLKALALHMKVCGLKVEAVKI